MTNLIPFQRPASSPVRRFAREIQAETREHPIRTVLGVAAIGLVVFAAISMYPEVQRYMRIKRM